MNSNEANGGKGKKRLNPGDQGVALPKLAQSETIHSLNLLYQSAAYSTIVASLQGASYGESIQRSLQLQSLAKKATLRLDSTIKRSLCKKCSLPLLPGLTYTIRCRTFAPSSRMIEMHCQMCSHKRRLIAPPMGAKYSNQPARSRRRRQRKTEEVKLQKKLIKYKMIDKPPKPVEVQRNPLPEAQEGMKGVKLSQRARRRAGRMKAEGFRKAAAQISIQKQQKVKLPIQRGPAALVRYADRKADENWEASWSSTSSKQEKEAIKLLRGDHTITCGVGRGGIVGNRGPSIVS
jgi:RNase P subunit RPR2